MDAVLGVFGPGRGAKPQVVVEPGGDGHGLADGAGGIGGQADFDGVKLTDAAVANQFAGEAEVAFGVQMLQINFI
jgi:hypothetical protein